MTPETVWILLAIAVIALGAGFVHSAIGFGFGIVAIALLPLVIDVRSSHVMLSLASVPMISMAAWTYREGIDWKSLRPRPYRCSNIDAIGHLSFRCRVA